MLIQVMGPGCAKCEETMKVVKQVVADAGSPAGIQIEKVTDFAEIAQAGVFSTPAVVIDGAIKVVGRVPKPAEVQGWIQG